MAVTGLYPAIVAALVAILFARMAIQDARTWTVRVAEANATTAIAVVGLSVAAVIDQEWGALLQAVAMAATVTGIQGVPYLLQQRTRAIRPEVSPLEPSAPESTPASEGPTEVPAERRIGLADVRLAIPFGWTLGWFGISFAFVGFAVAVLGGLAALLLTRRRALPFVPFLAVGLGVGLGLALAVELLGEA